MASKEYYEFTDRPAGETPDFLKTATIVNGVPTMPAGYRAAPPVLPDGYTGGEIELNGVRGLKMTRTGTLSGTCFLHIHGGGFTICSAMDAAPLLDHISTECGLDCYSVDYKLAPGQSYVGILEECLSFYNGLRELGYSKIIVGGESAGATLTLALTQALRDRKLPLPVCIWCSSPVMTQSFYTTEMFHTDFVSDTWPAAVKTVFGEGENAIPRAAEPLSVGFDSFPPTLLQVGGAESLCAANAKAVYEFCKAGVDLTFRCGQDMPHTYVMDYEAYPEAKEGMEDIVLFFKRHI